MTFIVPFFYCEDQTRASANSIHPSILVRHLRCRHDTRLIRSIWTLVSRLSRTPQHALSSSAGEEWCYQSSRANPGQKEEGQRITKPRAIRLGSVVNVNPHRPVLPRSSSSRSMENPPDRPGHPGCGTACESGTNHPHPHSRPMSTDRGKVCRLLGFDEIAQE